MHHIQLGILRASVVILLSLAAAGAAAAEDAAALIEQAYGKTKSAAKVEDFAEVIALCEQARDGELTREQKEYLERLLGWAHNRRGELYVEQAGEALEKGADERAAELDAKAAADFEVAVKYDATRWKAVHNRGVSYALTGDYERAVADFSRVIELNSRYAQAWFNRAESRYELDQVSEALGDYTQAIALNPSDAIAYVRRGHTHFRLRRFREALDDYNRAVQLNANHGETYANRGDAHQSLGMWERAAADFRRAIDLDPESPRAYQSAAWLMATCPDERYRNPQLAVDAARRAVDLSGRRDFRYLDTLAAAYASAGQFDEARSTLAEALESAPDEERVALEKRRELYEAGQPYRQDRAETAQAEPQERSR